MAGGAIANRKGSASGGVGGIVRGVVGGQVTLGIAAIIRLNCQRSVVAVVALVAAGDFAGRSDLVRVCQREAGGRVIESGIGPRDGVVAL